MCTWSTLHLLWFEFSIYYSNPLWVIPFLGIQPASNSSHILHIGWRRWWGINYNFRKEWCKFALSPRQSYNLKLVFMYLLTVILGILHPECVNARVWAGGSSAVYTMCKWTSDLAEDGYPYLYDWHHVPDGLSCVLAPASHNHSRPAQNRLRGQMTLRYGTFKHKTLGRGWRVGNGYMNLMKNIALLGWG